MITVFLDGRLGNQMFQYSFCRILAENNNLNFYIKHNKNEIIPTKTNSIINMYKYVNGNPYYYYSDLFNLDFGILDGVVNMDIYESNLTEKSVIPDNICIKGFFQNIDFYKNHIDKIKNWFIPKSNDMVKVLSDLYNTDEYCYIHFRGGDYKNIKKYYLPLDYYNNAKNVIKEYNKDIKFLIITDDVLEAKKFFPNDTIISNNENIDFCLLYNSKYTIIPNSTFSWWAKFLNCDNSIVVAPKGWFNYNDSKDGDKLEYDKFIYIK